MSILKRKLNISNDVDLENENMNENRKNIMWRNFSESKKWKAYVNHYEYTENWNETDTNKLLSFVKTKIDDYYGTLIRKGKNNMQNIVNEKCSDYPTLYHYCNVDNGNVGGSKPRKTKHHKSRKTKHHKSRKTKRHKSRKTKRRSKRKRV